MTARMARARDGALIGALVLLLAAPLVGAHGEERHLEDELVEDGERVLYGAFEFPQDGPLVVVPYVDGPLPCTPERGAVIAFDDITGVMFVANATDVQAVFDMPPERAGYAGFALDTHDASRALILMQENAVALHGLVGVVMKPTDNGTETATATGALGVPYPIPGTATHTFDHAVEGEGIVLDHDDSFPGGSTCVTEAGHVAVRIPREALLDSLQPGQVVHAVTLLDPELPYLLPRPIEHSTRLLQANLYLARPGEDPAAVRAAFDPSPGVPDVLPLLALALGLVWVGRK